MMVADRHRCSPGGPSPSWTPHCCPAASLGGTEAGSSLPVAATWWQAGRMEDIHIRWRWRCCDITSWSKLVGVGIDLRKRLPRTKNHNRNLLQKSWWYLLHLQTTITWEVACWHQLFFKFSDFVLNLLLLKKKHGHFKIQSRFSPGPSHSATHH